MRISEIVGNVTLSRCHPSFDGAPLRLAIPKDLGNLCDASKADTETIVVWDDLGSGNGCLIATSEGPEASQPFRPELKPVDAYAAGLLDSMDIDQDIAKQLLN